MQALRACWDGFGANALMTSNKLTHGKIYIRCCKNHGLEIKERGNGLVFVSSNGVAVKPVPLTGLYRNRIWSNGWVLWTAAIDKAQTNTQNAKTPASKAKHYQPRPLQTMLILPDCMSVISDNKPMQPSWRKEQWLKLREQRDLLIERAKRKPKQTQHYQACTSRTAWQEALYATVSLQFKNNNGWN